MLIYIASDHAGLERKQELVLHLRQVLKLEVEDFGPFDHESVDYPDFADKVCKHIPVLSSAMTSLTERPSCLGILICGSGQGMAMRANKYAHIKAALCWNEETAQLSREHNDANVLCLGARMSDKKLSILIAERFLSTPFAQGRHARRVVKMLSPV